MPRQRLGIALLAGAAITASLDAFILTVVLGILAVVLVDA